MRHAYKKFRARDPEIQMLPTRNHPQTPVVSESERSDGRGYHRCVGDEREQSACKLASSLTAPTGVARSFELPCGRSQQVLIALLRVETSVFCISW